MDIARDDGVRGGAAAPPLPGAVPPRISAERDKAQQSRAEHAGSRPSIAKIIEEIRAAFSARFHLFELEARRAAWAAAYMVAFAVGAALLGVTAWLILVGALIIGAVTAGVPWVAAAIVAIALHAVGVFLLVRGIRSMVGNLTFSATRRTLSQDNPSTHDDRSA